MTTLNEIIESGLGPNLWANRIERWLRRYRSISNVDLTFTGAGPFIGPYNSVEFEFAGRKFLVKVQEVKL